MQPSCSTLRVLPVALLLLATLAGCAGGQPPLYRWGIYEDQMYADYKNPGESDPITASTRLAEDVARTEAEGLAVPPGVHAHLGYLYYSQGDRQLARVHFGRERALYPESATFIDGILSRME